MVKNAREAMAIFFAPLILPSINLIVALIIDFPGTIHWVSRRIEGIGEGRFDFDVLSIVLIIAYVGNTLVALPAYIHYRNKSQASLSRCGSVGFFGGCFFATPFLVFGPQLFFAIAIIMGLCGAIVAATFCLIAGRQSLTNGI